MTQDRSKEMAQARKARMVGIVIAATMVLWMGVQFMGGKLGLPPRYAFLFDFAAIAALIWALVVTLQIWRARRDDKG
ncbi:DUF5337 domain-containing protein [Pseudooceanicola sp. HF7]|uniref:DUF5337 domain-containing protein n=1 Tax=Pseudooceanicola sp. HF7 TaxID=2721560 RepID=UPI00143223BC|nr:DUF5337 domain-containing protein [Pseudooceanicola sp. HF7]NIZ09203.1 DUF5337 domain-containing protein [Pseudooceanicola sp. HF7]